MVRPGWIVFVRCAFSHEEIQLGNIQCTVNVERCDNCMVVSYTFCYGVCSPKKPLLADDEAFRHLE